MSIFNKKNFGIIALTPLLLVVLSMIDMPFKYWVSWIENYSPLEIVFLSMPTILAGIFVGVLLVFLIELWKV